MGSSWWGSTEDAALDFDTWGMLTRILANTEKIMSAQQDIDAQTASIETETTDLTAAVAAIQAEIASLQASGVNTSGLDNAVAELTDAVSAAQAIPPAPTTTTGDTDGDTSDAGSTPSQDA